MAITGSHTFTVTCSARSGYRAHTYGYVPAWCNVHLGLRSYVDERGVIRYFCAQHEDAVRARWPERYVSEIDNDGLSESKRASEIAREDAFENGRLTFDLDVAE